MDDNSKKVFKILISSDNHLGYNEKHPIRGNDSFRTFEEVLQAAQKFNVDFILLAGDLFHINRPSMQTMSQAMSLIRKYCFGGDGQQNFSIKNFKTANCLDPNIKVKYPIFTIHGNHDDPIGMDRTCCLDLFAQSGLINYFGKQDNVDGLVLEPIIFEKEDSKMMIFGFGSMREERLSHLIQTKRFEYLTPVNTDGEELKKYLKILLIHQNRVPRPYTKHVTPYDLDDLPDIVIWGHEHDAKPELEYFEQNKFFILQPGSTVATSLCPSENGDKFYYILTCYYDESKGKPRFKIDSHRCETVRPFFMDTIDIDKVFLKKSFTSYQQQQKFLYNYCKKYCQQYLDERRTESENENEKPLLRLRIEYDDQQKLFDRRQFESEFNSFVANNDDIIRFVKKRSKNAHLYDLESIDPGIVELFDSMGFNEITLKKSHVTSVIEQYFENGTEEQKLSLYDENFLTEKLSQFVDKNSDDAFEDLFSNTKEAICCLLMSDPKLDLNEKNLREQIQIIKKKIECDEKYREKIQWINKEPFVKRSTQLMKHKLSTLISSLATNCDFNNDEQLPNTSFKYEEEEDDKDDFFNQEINVFDNESKSIGNKKKSIKKQNFKTPIDDDDDEDDDFFKFDSNPVTRKKIPSSSSTQQSTTTRKRTNRFIMDFDNDDDDDEEDNRGDNFNVQTLPAKRGRGRPARITKTTTTTRSRVNKTKSIIDIDDDDDDNEEDDKSQKTIHDFFKKK